MAGSKYEYVRSFETDDALLRDTFIVVRVDGRGFSRFTATHAFAKPNDARGIALMTQCAAAVMRDWGDAVLAFGQSDEFSLVFPRRTTVFGRRASKLATGVASQFASAYVFYWPRYFPGTPLQYPPTFDGRCVAYPTLASACDYVRWRQVDAHVNAVHNEAFWALVLRGGLTPEAAYLRLRGTLSEKKHEILHGFGVNYARLPAAFRRGTLLLRARDVARLPRALLRGAVPSAVPSAECGDGSSGGRSGEVSVTADVVHAVGSANGGRRRPPPSGVGGADGAMEPVFVPQAARAAARRPRAATVGLDAADAAPAGVAVGWHLEALNNGGDDVDDGGDGGGGVAGASLSSEDGDAGGRVASSAPAAGSRDDEGGGRGAGTSGAPALPPGGAGVAPGITGARGSAALDLDPGSAPWVAAGVAAGQCRDATSWGVSAVVPVPPVLLLPAGADAGDGAPRSSSTSSAALVLTFPDLVKTALLEALLGE